MYMNANAPSMQAQQQQNQLQQYIAALQAGQQNNQQPGSPGQGQGQGQQQQSAVNSPASLGANLLTAALPKLQNAYQNSPMGISGTAQDILNGESDFQTQLQNQDQQQAMQSFDPNQASGLF